MLRGRRRVGLALALLPLVLALLSCNLKAQPFANGSSKPAGAATVAMDVQPNPPRAGQDTDLTFTIRDANGPAAPSSVTPELVVDMPKMTMNLPSVPLQYDGTGRWHARYKFGMAGGWSATLRLARPSGDPAEATFQFDVGP